MKKPAPGALRFYSLIAAIFCIVLAFSIVSFGLWGLVSMLGAAALGFTLVGTALASGHDG